MQNFIFYSPTRVIFGRGAEQDTAKQILACGGKRVLVVCGGSSVLKSGLLEHIEALLTDAGLPYSVMGGARPNPTLAFARCCVNQAIRFGADFVLAVGGGSVIDTAKAAALGAGNPGTDIWSFWEHKNVPEKSLPIGVVLTISAAGSETSDSAVLTNEETGVKRGLSIEFNRPKFAVMNPELTFTLPEYQVGCGIVDIMMHTLDRYFTPTQGNELTDAMAEALLRITVKNGSAAMKNRRDYDAMSELMWCGSLSHNGLTGLGAVSDFATHQLGHELSAKFDVAHGASLSAVWGSWARHCMSVSPARFARLGREVWGLERESDEEGALAAIEATVAYFQSIGMPTSFSELGIGPQEDAVLRELADRCMFRGARTIGQFKVLGFDDALAIYTMANR